MTIIGKQVIHLSQLKQEKNIKTLNKGKQYEIFKEKKVQRQNNEQSWRTVKMKTSRIYPFRSSPVCPVDPYYFVEWVFSTSIPVLGVFMKHGQGMLGSPSQWPDPAGFASFYSLLQVAQQNPVLSLRLLSSWLLICSTDWFTKSTVSCLQLMSIWKPWKGEEKIRK